jgi:hypothetical protein
MALHARVIIKKRCPYDWTKSIIRTGIKRNRVSAGSRPTKRSDRKSGNTRFLYFRIPKFLITKDSYNSTEKVFKLRLKTANKTN